jgi:opacity protein-like surface antigen
MKPILAFFGLCSIALSGVTAGPDPGKAVVTPEPVCGNWYVSSYGGGSFFDSVDYRGTATGSFAPLFGEVTGDAGTGNGWIAGGALGFRTPDRWRFELDANHARSPFTGGVFSNTGTMAFRHRESLVGDVERTSVMVNAVKEFGNGRIHPYLGAGLGASFLNGSLYSDCIGRHAANEWAFAYQFMGGVAYDVLRCVQAYGEFRMLGQGDAENVLGDYGIQGEADLGWAQHLIFGVRWFF